MKRSTGRLLDYWQPPEGAGRALACVATTFTFDPDFFEAECLSRFLGIDARRGEGQELELAFLIHQEELLAETRVSVIVDRSQVREGRSLRWDVLPVGVPSGVQHSKVAVLVWERLVRILVSSANLTEGAYRSNVEVALALDALQGGTLPAALFDSLVEAVGDVVSRAPGDPSEPGPHSRAMGTLSLARERIAEMGLPRVMPAGVALGAVVAAPGRPVLPQLMKMTRGGAVRSALVMSPYFDTAETRSLAGDALARIMAQRGPAEVSFVVPVDTMDARTVVRAPQALRKAIPDRVDVSFRPFVQPDEDEVRRLHGKAILFENDAWTTLLVGSSNFTAAGLALSPYRANLEINVAVTAPRGSREGEALRSVLRCGPPLNLAGVQWAPDEDHEDDPFGALPWGFVDCLLTPQPPVMELNFDPDSLPARWSVTDPTSGTSFADSVGWDGAGRPARLVVPVHNERFPLFLEVAWETNGTLEKAGWAVNVTEPGKLPPPEELRNLPADALIRALASTRPVHESLAMILVERSGGGDKSDSELDPLKRYSGSGRLLVRARQVSAALSGLKERLGRPLGSLDALEWRLQGPLGPVALAMSLRGEAGEYGLLAGEEDFLLGELALTVSRVDWAVAAGTCDPRGVRQLVRGCLDDLRSLRAESGRPSDPRLAAYVDRAFGQAVIK